MGCQKKIVGPACQMTKWATVLIPSQWNEWAADLVKVTMSGWHTNQATSVPAGKMHHLFIQQTEKPKERSAEVSWCSRQQRLHFSLQQDISCHPALSFKGVKFHPATAHDISSKQKRLLLKLQIHTESLMSNSGLKINSKLVHLRSFVYELLY